MARAPKAIGRRWGALLDVLGFAPENSATERPTAEYLLAQLPSELVSGDGYAFGPTDRSGLAVGLLVENPLLSMGEDLRFRIAFRQTQPRERALVISRNWDPVARTRIGVLLDGGWFEPLDAPFFFEDSFSSEQTIELPLEAGETRSKLGVPVCLPSAGAYSLVVVFGGRPAFSFETTSGLVSVEVTE